MEDELRLFLLLGGTVFIIGVLAHGIWKIRKNTKPEEKPRVEPRQWAEENSQEESEQNQEGFDELGLGAVRVVGKPAVDDASLDLSHTDSALHDTANESVNGIHDDSSAETRKSVDEKRHEATVGHDDHSGSDGTSPSEPQLETERSTVPEESPEPKLYGSVVTNPKPHMATIKGAGRTNTDAGNSHIVADFPEPPGFLLKEGEDEPENVSVAGTEDASNQADSIQDESQAKAPSYEPSVTRSEPKLYVAPSEESESDVSDEVSAQQREVADFSLNAPTQPERIKATPESSAKAAEDQPRRFSRNKTAKASVRKREEPNFGDDQMRIDFDENDTDPSFSANEPSDSPASEKPQVNIEPEVLVLNVRAPEDSPIAGAALLPMLLTLGFKFGDQDIFHRHVNSNGKGPVLFSLANMFKPGVFDIDNLENFETQGVSLFMILPIEGDPHQVFNMMHNAARKLADEFGAQVLDGRRSVLTKQGLQQYVEKIREFERKRMIARN